MTVSSDRPAAWRLLASVVGPAADDSFARVLPALEAPLQRRALALLIRRGEESALAKAVGLYPWLDPATRWRMVRRIDRLFGAVRMTAGSDDEREAIGSIRLIADSGRGELAYLLPGALGHRSRRVHAQAAGALALLVERCAGQDVSFAPVALLAAVVDAVRRWPVHRQERVIDAALACGPRIIRELGPVLADRRSPTARAFGARIAANTESRWVPVVIAGLGHELLRPYAARNIGRAETPAYGRAILREFAAVDRVLSREELRAVRAFPWLTGQPDQWRHEGDDLVRAAVTLLAASSLARDSVYRIFRVLVDDARAAVREALVEAMVPDRSAAATELLRVIGHRDRGRPGQRARAVLRERSAGAAVAEHWLQRQSPTAAGIWKLLQVQMEQGRAGSNGRPVEVDAELRREFAALLRACWAYGDSWDRVSGIRAAAMLGIGPDVREALLRLVHDGDPVVRAEAVRSLPRAGGGEAVVRAVRSALGDSDERVRANAVEALDDLDAAGREQWVRPLLGAGEPRVRANAVTSLLPLGVADAGEELLRMLGDERSGHRLSSLWVLERLNLRSQAQTVEAMVGEARDRAVKAAAGRLLERWSRAGDRPPTGSEPGRADLLAEVAGE